MNDADGIDEAVEGGFRHTLMVATQLAERAARARQESLRQRESMEERQAVEAQRTATAERTAMRAAIAPVEQDQWWDTARPVQVAEAYRAAEAWKDHDPQALAASKRIHEEVARRYGINTHDLQGDGLYLQSGIEVGNAAQDRAEAALEQERGMALVAAAQTQELRSRAAALRPEVERHQVPEEYLDSPELIDALTRSRDAVGSGAEAAADRDVAARVHLIEKDGINGPSIEQLREEIGRNYSGADDSLFADAGFVAAARDWHEARALAEGGFVDKGDTALEARYERSERELFTRIGEMGRDIESNVLIGEAGRLRDDAAQAQETASAAYGSAEHRGEFAASLAGSASQEHIDARVLAATDQGKHPREAVRTAAKPSARKARASSVLGRDKDHGGPSR